MIPNPTESAHRDRLPTGVPGLDAILSGGLWRGSVYVLQGAPGTGKTILANQICANVARDGGRAFYVSMLAESFTTMLAHLGRLTFFDADHVGDTIRYVSGFNALEEGGFTGVLGLLRSESQRHGADFVVLDTVGPLQDATPNELQFKRRLVDLQALGNLAGFVTLLLTNEMREERAALIQQMADGVIELDDETHGVRQDRSLVVTKLRGSASLRGRHTFRIGPDGVRVFPRLESLASDHAREGPSELRLGTGVRELDAMLRGGVPSGTVTGLIGGPGSGKTSLGLHFLGSATPDAPGLLFGFFERPEALRQAAASMGIDLPSLERSGALRFVWQSQGEHLLDELAQRLLEEVDACGARRVLLDGFEALVEAATEPERMTRFMTALAVELRRRGATTFLTTERDEILGLGVRRPIRGSSPIFDNLIVVRSVEQRARLVRLLSIAKVRGSGFDRAIYEFDITEEGVRVGQRWSGQGEACEPTE